MSDLDILARTLYGEARGEGQEGIEAVACVIMNRVRARKWFTGYVIKEGIKIPSVEQTCLKRYQFSCWNKFDPNRKIINQVTAHDAVFRQCLLTAQKAISGELQDFTNGALYYHTREITPVWAKNKTPCYEVKHHLFYREV